MYVNEEHYEPTEYGDQTIRRESRIISLQINEQVPSYYSLFIETNELVDSSDYLQLTGATQTTFYNHRDDLILKESIWKNFPTNDEPLNRFKYVSFFFKHGGDLKKI